MLHYFAKMMNNIVYILRWLLLLDLYLKDALNCAKAAFQRLERQIDIRLVLKIQEVKLIITSIYNKHIESICSPDYSMITIVRSTGQEKSTNYPPDNFRFHTFFHCWSSTCQIFV